VSLKEVLPWFFFQKEPATLTMGPIMYKVMKSLKVVILVFFVFQDESPEVDGNTFVVGHMI
jgi:hypothetical protein